MNTRTQRERPQVLLTSCSASDLIAAFLTSRWKPNGTCHPQVPIPWDKQKNAGGEELRIKQCHPRWHLIGQSVPLHDTAGRRRPLRERPAHKGVGNISVPSSGANNLPPRGRQRPAGRQPVSQSAPVSYLSHFRNRTAA